MGGVGRGWAEVGSGLVEVEAEVEVVGENGWVVEMADLGECCTFGLRWILENSSDDVEICHELDR